MGESERLKEPSKFHQKLLELIHKFSKVAGYEINIQKSVAFLYIKNKLSERGTKKTIPFTSFKKNKIPRNKLNQGCKRPILEKL